MIKYDIEKRKAVSNTGKGIRIMFTLRIAYYQSKEHYSEAMLENKYEHSLFSVPFIRISDMNEQPCLWIESD